MKLYRPNCEITSDMGLPEGLNRQALVVEYNGSGFRGFQKQASTAATVQGRLEKALSAIAAQPITLVCAGRTDAGVHATAQVVHFDTTVVRPSKAWVEGANTHLPAGVRITDHIPVPLNFHARFSATARTYRYIIYSNRTRPAICSDFVTWLSYPLDVNKLHAAAQSLVGEHDFTSFRASYCQANNPVRTLRSISVKAVGPFVVMEVSANAFLHHMVRNIVGALLEVGRGAKPVSWIEELLELRDRNKNAATAPSDGLFFVGVSYPANFGFSEAPKGPIFLSYPNP